METAVRTGTEITVRYKKGKGPKPFPSIAKYRYWLRDHQECWVKIAYVTLVTDSVSLMEPRLGFFEIPGVKGATAQNNGTTLIVNVRRPRSLVRAFNVAVGFYPPDGGGSGGPGEPAASIIRSLHEGAFERHLYLVKNDTPAQGA